MSEEQSNDFRNLVAGQEGRIKQLEEQNKQLKNCAEVWREWFVESTALNDKIITKLTSLIGTRPSNQKSTSKETTLSNSNVGSANMKRRKTFQLAPANKNTTMTTPIPVKRRRSSSARKALKNVATPNRPEKSQPNSVLPENLPSAMVLRKSTRSRRPTLSLLSDDYGMYAKFI